MNNNFKCVAILTDGSWRIQKYGERTQNNCPKEMKQAEISDNLLFCQSSGMMAELSSEENSGMGQGLEWEGLNTAGGSTPEGERG